MTSPFNKFATYTLRLENSGVVSRPPLEVSHWLSGRLQVFGVGLLAFPIGPSSRVLAVYIQLPTLLPTLNIPAHLFIPFVYSTIYYFLGVLQ
jgi:hypothetical protein